MKPHPLFVSCAVALALTGCGVGCPDGFGEPPPPPPEELPEEPAKLAVTPVGSPLGAVVEAAIPPSGGTLTSADGRLTVEIPAGALAVAQTLSLQPIMNKGPSAVGHAYRLGPDGQTFAAPVKVTFKYTADELDGSEAAALGVAYQDKEGRWQSFKTVSRDEAAQTVSVQTTHFTDFSLYPGWKLMPSVASTPPRQYVALAVMICSAPDPGSDELTNLRYTCAPDPEFFTVQEWAVNGIRNGNSEVGTITGSVVSGLAQYLAPAKAPAANPVTVSASLTNKAGRKTLLTATIWIDAHPPYDGVITSRAVNTSDPGDIYTTIAAVLFTWDNDQNQYVVARGIFTGIHDQLNPGGAGCEIHTKLEGEIGATDGAIIFQDKVYFATGRTLGLLKGTTTCTSTGAAQPISVYGNAIWWPAPQERSFTPKRTGELEESLTGVIVYGSKTNVEWSFKPIR